MEDRAQTGAPPARSAATVLVIEDELGMLEILSVNLQASGFRVVTASDGVDGWQAFEREQPDLVLLDLNLPRVSGFRLLELFKGPAGDPGVPVVALTALDFVEAEELVRLGLDGFIKKPFEPKELVETLRHVLAQRR
ncbi:MAG: response regulator [Chloroflexi bacterium]|nr:response regulator [Chloroflexota bacterium]